MGEEGQPLEDQDRCLLVALTPVLAVTMLVFPLTAPGTKLFHRFITQSLLCRGVGSSEHPKTPRNNPLLAAVPFQGFAALLWAVVRGLNTRGWRQRKANPCCIPGSWEVAQALESLIDMALPSACLNLHK